MFKNNFTLISIVSISFLFFGCATLFAPKKNPLSVSSDPSGAEVFVNGNRVGETPINLKLRGNKSYLIEFRKEGFSPVTREINTKVGAGWVILDVLGGVLPVVIDAVTGDWKKLDQQTINATLSRQNH